MQTASETGDIAAIMRLIATSAQLKPADFIKKTVGNLRFLYYTYLDQLHNLPLDIEDLIDGMLYLDARGYVQDCHMKEVRAYNESHKQR